jgi:hypothetical protein
MTLTIEDLKTVFADRLWLSLPQPEPRLPRRDYATAAGHRNAQLNHCCLQAFLAWASAESEITDPPVPWPSTAELPQFWDLVTGTAITLGQHRLVLLPSDALDTQVLSVPQEWVDIPTWAADYYLGLQVDPEAKGIQIWGYASHCTLKAKATYDPIYRTYDLDRDFVIADLDLLWVAQRLGLDEKAPLGPLPVLSPAVAELAPDAHPQALLDLSQPTPYSPRLDLAFPTWATLIANPTWRHQLYQQRLASTQAGARTVAMPASKSPPPLTHLSQRVINAAIWLQDQVDQMAQELNWVLLPALALETVGLRDRTLELTEILTQLQQRGFQIPPTARSAYHDFQMGASQLRLYAVTWPVVTAGKVPEWCLLFVLANRSGRLQPSTKLTIRDDHQTLVDLELAADTTDQYLCGSVSGTWEETFVVQITLADGTALQLPAFVFQPEPTQ